jgi:DNA-binding IclR family transcriptional regulator
MAGLERYVRVLRLFDENAGLWTIQAISETLHIPTSTTYRLVRELVAHGFLDQATEAQYRLGPAFVEFDRRVRLTDPLISQGLPFLDDLIGNCGLPALAIIARLYGNEVICVADMKSPNAQIPTSYERGKPMPLLRGATSKAILAQLPARRLSKLLANVDGATQALPSAEWKKQLAEIKRRGYCITRGEVDKGLVGIASPVTSVRLGISASISIIARAKDVPTEVERRVVVMLVAAATLLSDQLSGHG